MRTVKIATIIISLLIIGLLFNDCSVETKKKIVYINSYHAGHPSSDEIMEGFVRNMPPDSFQVFPFYMDTKRNPSKEFIEKRASELLDSIRSIHPDILLVSDDNAVKYIVEPHLKELAMPIVFCGVNWTDKDYNLPKKQVTGIIEILPVADALKSIKKYYPTMEKLLVLNENTTTSRKEEQILDTLFQGLGFSATYKLVDDFEEWKNSFQNGNQTYDIIYISTNAAIKGWNKTEAVDFIRNNIKVPVFTCEDFMMPYAVFGVTKIAEEHGIWAASTAKKILSGVAPENIPVTKNKLSNTWLNAHLAEKIEFYPDSVFMENTTIVAK